MNSSQPPTLLYVCFLASEAGELHPYSSSPYALARRYWNPREGELAKLSSAKGSVPPEMKAGSLGLS